MYLLDIFDLQVLLERERKYSLNVILMLSHGKSSPIVSLFYIFSHQFGSHVAGAMLILY